MMKKYTGLILSVLAVLVLASCAPVTLETVPSGAAVYDATGNIQLGTTPYETRIFFSGKTFTLRKDRYFDEPYSIEFDAPRDISVALRPTPVLVYSKPLANLYPAGSDEVIGRTPIKVPVSDTEKSYVLKAKDYYDKEISLSTAAKDPTVVELDRRPIVTISATPADVNVYENDKLIGKAPVIEEILSERTFEFRKENYFTKTLTLKGAPPYEVNVDLKPFPVITVDTIPAGSQVYRNGKLLGTAPVQLPVGEKIAMEARADRYYPEAFSLDTDSPAKVVAKLKAMPYVTVDSSPAGADVFIGDKKAGTAPVELLVEKTTTVELRKDGYITGTKTLSGSEGNVNVTLEKVPEPVVEPTNTAPAAAEAPKAPEKKSSFWDRFKK